MPVWTVGLSALAVALVAVLFLSPFLLPRLYHTARQRDGDIDLSCKKDLSCWTEHNLVAAQRACVPAIEEKADHGFRWTSGWLDSIFFDSHALSPDDTKLEYAGDSIEFSDAAGHWKAMSYYCAFDTDRQTLDAARIVQGDNPDN